MFYHNIRAFSILSLVFALMVNYAVVWEHFYMMTNNKMGKQRKLRREDKKLADQIKKLRVERNLSQEELSLRLGRNTSYIAYIETYRRGVGLPTLYKIAKIFDVKVRDLFTF